MSRSRACASCSARAFTHEHASPHPRRRRRADHGARARRARARPGRARRAAHRGQRRLPPRLRGCARDRGGTRARRGRQRAAGRSARPHRGRGPQRARPERPRRPHGPAAAQARPRRAAVALGRLRGAGRGGRDRVRADRALAARCQHQRERPRGHARVDPGRARRPCGARDRQRRRSARQRDRRARPGRAREPAARAPGRAHLPGLGPAARRRQAGAAADVLPPGSRGHRLRRRQRHRLAPRRADPRPGRCGPAAGAERADQRGAALRDDHAAAGAPPSLDVSGTTRASGAERIATSAAWRYARVRRVVLRDGDRPNTIAAAMPATANRPTARGPAEPQPAARRSPGVPPASERERRARASESGSREREGDGSLSATAMRKRSRGLERVLVRPPALGARPRSAAPRAPPGRARARRARTRDRRRRRFFRNRGWLLIRESPRRAARADARESATWVRDFTVRAAVAESLRDLALAETLEIAPSSSTSRSAARAGTPRRTLAPCSLVRPRRRCRPCRRDGDVVDVASALGARLLAAHEVDPPVDERQQVAGRARAARVEAAAPRQEVEERLLHHVLSWVTASRTMRSASAYAARAEGRRARRARPRRPSRSARQAARRKARLPSPGAYSRSDSAARDRQSHGRGEGEAAHIPHSRAMRHAARPLPRSGEGRSGQRIAPGTGAAGRRGRSRAPSRSRRCGARRLVVAVEHAGRDVLVRDHDRALRSPRDRGRSPRNARRARGSCGRSRRAPRTRARSRPLGDAAASPSRRRRR